MLIIYASLHPWSGWRDTGAETFAWLTAPWPRYWTWFDLLTNIAAYFPLAFFWAAHVQPRRGFVLALLLAAADGACLSLVMETTQGFLESRVASNLDFGGNSLGAILGAIFGARYGHNLVDTGKFLHWRNSHITHGTSGDIGLILLLLWLPTQLAPENLLFGNGDIRRLLNLNALMPFDVACYGFIEAMIVGINTYAVAAAAACLALHPIRTAIIVLFIAALSLKSLALALSLELGRSFDWATPGSIIGLSLGAALGLSSHALPWRVKKITALCAILIANILVNLAPENPYRVNTWQTWNPGQLLNFFGLTAIIASAWPFLALPWLITLRPQRKAQ